MIERVMKRFWDTCVSLDVPVMSHAGPSMGSDDAHDQLGGPGGWEELAKAFDGAQGNTPRVNLGHFGGDGDTTTAEDWTRSFADKVMLRKGGKFVYGDLGFWDKLACGLVGNDDCNPESAR